MITLVLAVDVVRGLVFGVVVAGFVVVIFLVVVEVVEVVVVLLHLQKPAFDGTMFNFLVDTALLNLSRFSFFEPSI